MGFPDFLIIAANFGKTITHMAPAASAENSQSIDKSHLSRAASADEFFVRFGEELTLEDRKSVV